MSKAQLDSTFRVGNKEKKKASYFQCKMNFLIAQCIMHDT